MQDDSYIETIHRQIEENSYIIIRVDSPENAEKSIPIHITAGLQDTHQCPDIMFVGQKNERIEDFIDKYIILMMAKRPISDIEKIEVRGVKFNAHYTSQEILDLFVPLFKSYCNDKRSDSSSYNVMVMVPEDEVYPFGGFMEGRKIFDGATAN